MDTIFDQLIADFHERPLPALTRRDIRLPWIPGKIDTVMGMRRSGKTWFVYQVIDDLLNQGRSKESVLYVSLEDERILPLKGSELHRIPEAYYRRYPHLKTQQCVFCLDEVQNVVGWETFARRLLDTENVHLVLTGSSAKLLSREIATGLRGRAIATEIFPFRFSEALRHAGIEAPGSRRPGSGHRARIEHAFRRYLLEGGFPEVQSLQAEYRVRILQDYLDVVILRDVVDRHQVANTTVLRTMIRHLLNAAACLFSVNKFYQALRSQGLPAGKNTLHDYLAYLADAYLFFPVAIRTRSERARSVNPKKMYAIDTGLVQACSRSVRPDWGHLLENFVFLELRRRHRLIEYYRTQSGLEVDFIVPEQDGTLQLIQVSAEIENPSTRERELRALTEAMQECGLSSGTVVTFNHEEFLQAGACSIRFVPAWLWALQDLE
mgnify:FL=1